MMRRGLVWLGRLCLLGTVLCTAMLAWLHWRPAPQWDVAFGPAGWRLHLNGDHLVRFATQPWIFRAVSGRSFTTRFGHLNLIREGNGLLVRCAPCTLRAAAYPETVVHLTQVDLRLTRSGDTLRGTLASGAVTMSWQGLLSPGGLALNGELPATPAQDVLGLLYRDIPEIVRIRVEGSIGGHFALSLPDKRWQLTPDIRILRVAGLGTEALRGLQPVPACASVAAGGFGQRIGKAVIAAEDQRFANHLGYDPQELAAALTPNIRQGHSLRGASTLDEQVARMLFTGASRSPVRKLRELLYAIEMDRTLGKAQIMRLYLSLAPWGDGICGVEAAARHYLGKPSNRLNLQEAAWLASLLRNPSLVHSAPEAVRQHARWVLKGMPGIGRRERRVAEQALSSPLLAGLP